MKFRGSIEELQVCVASMGLSGKWTWRDDHRFHAFRARSGEALNWWPKTGTIMLQGYRNEQLQQRLLQLSLEQKLPLLAVAAKSHPAGVKY